MNDAARSDRLVGDLTFELPLNTGFEVATHPWIHREGGQLFNGRRGISISTLCRACRLGHEYSGGRNGICIRIAGLSLAQEAQRLRRLMDDCADHHGSCAVVGSANAAPSLLLHVADASVRLVEVSSLPGHDVGYACFELLLGQPRLPESTADSFHAKWHKSRDGTTCRGGDDGPAGQDSPRSWASSRKWSARFDVGLYRAGLLVQGRSRWSSCGAAPWRALPAPRIPSSTASGPGTLSPATKRLCACSAARWSPVIPALPNGAGQVGQSCVYESVDLTRNEMPFAFLFDDDPRPADLEALWLLTVGDTEPWSCMYEVGIGVVEVKGDGRCG